MWPPTLRARGLFAVFALVQLGSAPPALSAELPASPTLRVWVEEFKQSPKGPFENIRWFCKDGTVLPPRAYACADHGGGIQHGNWNQRAAALREGGYAVANVLARLDADQFVGDTADLDTLKQILLERFLIGWDDGWIFRGARSYRGALQIEDEEAGSLRAVLAMLADPAWRDPARFMLLRETVRLLPLQADEGSASAVRQFALVIADKDPGFTPLRAKIHNQPDAGDAEKVREYARTKGKKALGEQYAKLAADIDALYAPGGATDEAVALAGKVENVKLARSLNQLAEALATETEAAPRLATAGRFGGLLRKYFPGVRDPQTALELLQLSLALETEAYVAGNTLLTRISRMSRRQRLALLDDAAETLYGAGFLSIRQLAGVKQSIARIEAYGDPPLGAYRQELRYLARTPEWSGRWLEFNFGPQVARWASIEPEVHLYAQDRQRGSPLLFYGAVIDGLVLDANHLAGIEHRLFGEGIGAGFRALNPGLARGVVRSSDGDGGGEMARDGIYLLPETTADLPPVAGILTSGEGSSLSHVQLLARNLGIPNVVVAEELLPKVQQHIGSAAVLAVSPNGVVQLAADGPEWDAILGEQQSKPADVVIRPDLEKLDVESAQLLPLSGLRASDSGRTSGPKGANLGELKHHFGDMVPNGFVIPFGVFRRLLDQPLEPGGPPVFEWMKAQYDAIAAERNPARQERKAKAFLARLRQWILAADPGPEFRSQLRAALQKTFGEDGTYGVFLRSDTNVEDLPGFTGAGLNLTVPYVVGYDRIVKSIHDVWASPFTDRSYAWRQSHMEDPEYVFPAVVVQIGFPAEKSGVMVTVDVETGESGWLTIAVNEGVGGGVEGQATESLLVREDSGEVRLLAQATAPEKAVLSRAGGIAHVPASGTDTVLEKDEIAQLIAFAKEVREFDALRDEQGRPLPADVEFAFRGGRLALLQIRPFVESRRAQSNAYLSQLDASFRARGQQPVPLDGVPRV